ncbi:hypothetical protein CMUC_1917 [Campylobacter mucosalis CCUG 21559]|uniref:Uncharacterized protein n=1 Tax=Campylobacter mucosalis CCUG 21559 TaxID=1032067 RepID=A0A6G5QIZ2_9BACT|nr:hypothetical protein CMUC_1917 [Campylobacter mucosalis CCUG 21559]
MLLQVIVFCSLFVCDNLCNITLISNQDTIITDSNLNAENTITKQTTTANNLNINITNTNKSNNQENNKKDKDTNQHNKISSINYTNNRNLNYTHSKTLATIGQGSINIKDKENSDDISRLNTDTTKINKDLYSTNISSNINSTLDTRLLSKEGREQVKREFEDMDKNMATIAQTLPDENSDNPFEASVGYVWNTLAMLTGDILFSNANNGGLLGQLGGKENLADQYVVVSNDADIYKNNKELFKHYGKNDKGVDIFVASIKDFNKNMKDIDKLPIEAFGNGVLNSKNNAINGAIISKGMNDKNSVSVLVNYNPTRGILADTIESAWDKFIGTTEMAKITGEFYKDWTSSKACQESRCVFDPHSQHTILLNSGINYIKNKDNNGFLPASSYKYEPSVVAKGIALSPDNMRETIQDLKHNFTYIVNDWDLVSNVFGLTGSNANEYLKDEYKDKIWGHSMQNYNNNLYKEIKFNKEK